MNSRTIADEVADTNVDRALRWLVEQGGETDEAPPGMNEYERMDTSRQLLYMDLIYKERSAAGEWTISSLGKEVAKHLIDGRKENGWLRRNLLIREMLVWIEDDRPHAVSEFAGRMLQEVATTERETSSALEFLRENHLVTGLPAADTLIKPKLTSAGRRLKDHSDLPEKALYQGGIVNNNHSNNVSIKNSTVGAVSAGDNATQSGNTASSSSNDEILAQIQEIRKTMSVLPDVPESVSVALEELEGTASDPQAEKSQLKELFGVFAGALAAKFGEATWGGVLKLTAGLAVLCGI